MGNYLYSTRYNDLLINQISKYKAGDIEEFTRLAELGKNSNGDIRFRAWKIACLYYYMTKLPESMHDIGASQPFIIAEYEELSSSNDPQVKTFIAIALGEPFT